jgi:type I restriction enzyme, S subunit
LLKGLEITEIALSKLKIDNEKLRIDSEYFSKSMLNIEEIVREYSHGFDLIGKIFSRFVKGIFDINSDSYVSEGVPFLRILNLKNGIIQTNNIAYITEKVHQIESKLL